MIRDKIFRFLKEKVYNVPEGATAPYALQKVYKILWPIHYRRYKRSTHYIPFASYDILTGSVTIFGEIFTKEFLQDWDLEKFFEMQNKAIKWDNLQKKLGAWKMTVGEMIDLKEKGQSPSG